eukprot:PhF_6_TR17507/c0_g1_i1/m.26705/K03105/SRP19; signal recognition particle subunit SRP19
MSRPTPPEIKHFQVIYPEYLNKKFTKELGRRVSQAKGLDDPTASEVHAACQALGLQAVLEPWKGFPSSQARDPVPAPRGRVRVLLKQPKDKHYIKKSEFDVQTRVLTNESIPTKGALLVQIADEVRKLRSRSGGSTTSTTTTGGGGGKKSKK